MAWAANVTLYDDHGVARRSFRYGADAGHDIGHLVARVADDVEHWLREHPGTPVACVQDGATDLAPLRNALRERLPPGTRLLEITDFHHATKHSAAHDHFVAFTERTHKLLMLFLSLALRAY